MSEVITTIELQEIMELLPHRYPFLLVDRVIEYEADSRIVGIKNVTINEPFFQGHFPGIPIMPGVLIIEAMAQVGGVLVFKTLPDRKRSWFFSPPSRTPVSVNLSFPGINCASKCS